MIVLTGVEVHVLLVPISAARPNHGKTERERIPSFEIDPWIGKRGIGNNESCAFDLHNNFGIDSLIVVRNTRAFRFVPGIRNRLFEARLPEIKDFREEAKCNKCGARISTGGISQFLDSAPSLRKQTVLMLVSFSALKKSTGD